MSQQTEVPAFVLRTENSGDLLWSHSRDTYFFVSQAAHTTAIRQVAQGDLSIENIDDPQLQAELMQIGFDGSQKTRIVDSPIPGRLSAPLETYFDYTWACNLRCSYCYNFDVPRATTLPSQQIRHVFAELAQNGVMRTHLAGGEPMINPRGLRTYLESAAENGLRASVNSNGTLFTDEIADFVFGQNLVSLTFSVDGPSSQLHDHWRGPGSFDITTAAVRRAVAKKQATGSDTRIQIKAVWFPTTSHEELAGLVALGINLGADVVQFHNPERCTNHPNGYYSKLVPDYYDKLSYITQLQEKYADRIAVWNVCNPLATQMPIGIPGGHGCIGGQELIAINPDGSMSPCLMHHANLGNLFTDWGGSFSDFWRNSEVLAEFQAKVQRVDATCMNCAVYSACRGGSKTRVIADSGNAWKDGARDPFCPADYAQNARIPLTPVPSSSKILQRISVAHSL